MHLLAGLDRPDSGTISLAGQDLASLDGNALARMRLEHVGFVFQSFNLLPTLSARVNVEAAMVESPLRGTERAAKALELLDAVGMAGRAGHLPSRLSGGEQQRVAIARALANDPEIVFADEPTGDLDTRTGSAVMGLFRDLCERRGTAVIVVTHAPYVSDYATHRAEMKDGVLVYR